MIGDQSTCDVVAWTAPVDVFHGQAIVTRHVLDLGAPIRWRKIFYRRSSRYGVIRYLVSVIKVLYYALFRGHRVYLVGSRSKLGFVKDIPAYVPALLGSTVTVHFHGSDVVTLLSSRIVGWTARCLLSRCEVIVPSSHLVADRVLSELTRVHLCENFAGVSPSAEIREVGKTRPFKLLWNSNVMSSKGFFELLKAVEAINSRGPIVGVEFRVLGATIGDSEMSETEVQMSLERVSHPWFSYSGPVGPEEVAAYLEDCDCVALPSRYASECQPLALIDAMCSGRMVLATDTPALRATLGSYPACYAADTSVEALVVALETLMAEKTECVDQVRVRLAKAKVLAQERFSKKRFDADMIHVLTG